MADNMAQDTNKSIQPRSPYHGNKVCLCSMRTIDLRRGALPPIIFLAMYESGVVSNYFGSLGYLVVIISSLTFAMMPRGKFIESVIRNIFFTCLAVPVTIFGLWCCRQAKLNTQPPGSTAAYNSSAAAVAATFLFFSIFAINSFRAVWIMECDADL